MFWNSYCGFSIINAYSDSGTHSLQLFVLDNRESMTKEEGTKGRGGERKSERERGGLTEIGKEGGSERRVEGRGRGERREEESERRI